MENLPTPNAMMLLLRHLVMALLGDKVLCAAVEADPTTRMGGKTHYLLRARVRLAKRMLRAWLYVQAAAVAFRPPDVAAKAKLERETTERTATPPSKFIARVKLYQTRRKDKRAPEPKRASPPMLDEVREWLFADVEHCHSVVAKTLRKPKPDTTTTPKAGQLVADLHRIAAILDAPDRAVQRVAQRLAPPENYADRLRKWRFPMVEPVAPNAALCRKLGALELGASDLDQRPTLPTPKGLAAWWKQIVAAITPEPLPD